MSGDAAYRDRGLEGGFFGRAAAGVPGVGRRCLGRLAGPGVRPAATAEPAAAAAAGPGGLGDLRGRELQRRADFLDVHFDARALRAVLALVLTNAKRAGDDDPLALGERL